MTKKTLNQNAKYHQELINAIEPDFNFNNVPINRISASKNTSSIIFQNKIKKLEELKKKIDSIENCNLKENSKKIVFGNGNIDSPVMLIGEAPGVEEEKSGLPFQGEIGELLKKMLQAINIDIQKIYLTYSINFRTPKDRKPTTQEIKRYSIFLKEANIIINEIIVKNSIK